MSGSDFNRIDHFRQIQKEIRGSSDYLIVGIDIAKEKHFAFMGDTNGRTILRRLSFENNRQGFDKLITYAETNRVKHDFGKLIFGLEPTATYHKALGEFLIRNGYSLVLVGASATSKNRELLDGRWDKNDMKDSANVADLISQGKCLYYDHAQESIRNLRSLLSLKRKLKKVEHSTRMRIRNHLVAQFFPELDSFFSGYAVGCLSIVKHCFDPAAVSQMPLDGFVSLVTSRPPTRLQWEKLKSIWELAPLSVGCKITRGVAFEAALLVDNLRKAEVDIKAVDEEIRRICQSLPEYEFVMSIPGFGEYISATTLAAIGNPMRFNNTRQLLKMAGLDLSSSRSGKHAGNQTTRISKKGNSPLRYSLYQAAMIASSRNLDFMAYYTKLIAGREKEKGIKTRMRVKLSAKMLIIAWTLMKRKTVFDPAYLQTK